METTMNLKEFIEQCFDKNPWHAMHTAEDLIELQAIEQRLNLKWGIELDIKVKPAERKEGRFFGKSLIDSVIKDVRKK